jgi:hypothetical protein
VSIFACFGDVALTADMENYSDDTEDGPGNWIALSCATKNVVTWLLIGAPDRRRAVESPKEAAVDDPARDGAALTGNAK